MKERQTNSPLISHLVEYLDYNGVSLALHSWTSLKTTHLIFYIHGIQSHSGWLFESGPYFAKNSISVFSLDRRGSGLSGGSRGDIADPTRILDDYIHTIKLVKTRYPSTPITFIGQSLGGTILAALISLPDFDLKYSSLIFCASPLGKRSSMSNEVKEKIASYKSDDELIKLNIDINDFTDLHLYLQFMLNDTLSIKQITKRSINSILRMEEIYIHNYGTIKEKSAFLCPETDPIIDIKLATEIFMRLTSQKGIVKIFNTCKHYLWFTKQSNHVHSWIKSFILN